MRNSKKGFFTRHYTDIVLDIGVSDFEHSVLNMKLRKGVYTIKNVVPANSDDLFVIESYNTVPGYLPAQDAEYLNLADGKKKIVASICNSFYHSLLDDVSELLHCIALYPDHDVIIDTSEIRHMLEAGDSSPSGSSFFQYFLSQLKENGVKYKLVNLKEYDVVYIDNFRTKFFPFDSGKKTSIVHDFFNSGISNKGVFPNRKVFVSRSEAGRWKAHAPGLATSEDGMIDDSRIDDHARLEKIFTDMGFEIVHAEKFKSFKDQLEYFQDVKVIAGLTGSGLTNAAFMQPGGVVVEIVSPLLVPIGRPGESKKLDDPWYVHQIHNFYKNVAFHQNHLYLAIQSPTFESEKVEDLFEDKPHLKTFLSTDYGS